jgi:predicted Zn finger-like uncharacterized protein
MFTVCPKCALTLAVTAADLRVAQGYVRCGRCSSVFNAIARLTEERQAGASAETAPFLLADEPVATPAPTEPAVSAPQPPAAVTAPPAPLEPEEPIPEDALEFNPATTDVNSVFVQPPPDPQWAAATGSFRALVAANQDTPPEELLPDSQVDVEIDAAFLASMLRSETPAPAAPPVPARPVAAPQAAPAPQATKRHAVPAEPPSAAPLTTPARSPRHTGTHSRPASGAALAPPARAATSWPERPGTEAVAQEPHAIEEPSEASAEDEPQRSLRLRAQTYLRAHAWLLGASGAAVLLLAQIINHARDELAASARLNGPLTAFYGALGIKLFPRWDLRAYDVRQLGASAADSGNGVITVRATIKNESPQAQPLPLLRVTLQDRFGNRIAARDVQPHSYLPGAIPASSFLSAGQRIDAEMGFADPGKDAVGFEIDACLPARGGGVACANDAALR